MDELLRQRVRTAAAILILCTLTTAQQFSPLVRGVLPASSDSASQLRAGDLDGDGIPDLIASTPTRCVVYHNDGHGTFTELANTGLELLATAARQLHLADIDGDGDLDVVHLAADPGLDPTIPVPLSHVFRNDGQGGFTPVLAGEANGFVAVAVGDFDSDGDDDFYLVGSNQPNVYMRNDGSLGLVRVPQSVSPVLPTAAAVGDVDGDGDPDIVILTLPGVLLLRNNSGAFTVSTVDNSSAIAAALGDVDGDGDLDLALISTFRQVRLAINDGTGTFVDATGQLPPTSSNPSCLLLADVDGDGDSDLFSGSDLDCRLWRNNGVGVFTDSSLASLPTGLLRARSLASADFDGDGDVDIAIGGLGVARLLVNAGNGSFSVTPSRFPEDILTCRAIAVGDFDGDGRADVVVGAGGPARLYPNHGLYFGETPILLPPSISANAIASGDFDGDGDLDLVFANTGQDQLLRNAGNGLFRDVTLTAMPAVITDAQAVLLHDFDGDGDLDLVLGNAGSTSFYRNQGYSHYVDDTAASLPFSTATTNALAAGDIDGDGDDDLVLGIGFQSGTTNGINRIYRNDGTGHFTDVTSTSLPPDADFTIAIALADIDGDGDLDLVAGNDATAGGRSRLYVNDGLGNFTDASGNLPLLAETVLMLGVGDLDADGDVDMLVITATRRRFVLVNDGAGRFTRAEDRIVQQSDQTSAMVLADIDGDGDLDAVMASGPGRIAPLFNLRRQLDAPLPLRVGQPYRLDIYEYSATRRSVDLALPFASPAAANVPYPPFGTIGIDMAQAVAMPAVLVPRSGLGTLTFTVPSAPGLVGLTFYVQALLTVDNALTGTIADTIGN